MVIVGTTALPMVISVIWSVRFFVGWEWWVNRALDEPYNAYLTDAHTFDQKSADFLFGLT